MKKLNYCLECKKIFISGTLCTYCTSNNIKELSKRSPVNVIGTKIKGKFLRLRQGQAEIVLVDDNKKRSVKSYEISKIKKIL
ncbi:MAG: hypothetical protein N3I35_10865 [Clostridia bacterium]|nr:hypothetical protein [Clostridia bacterium]